MPINIYNQKNIEKIAWLCDDDWELPSQIYELEEWLKKNESNIPPGDYVADIGFDIRKDATGGGGVLTIKSMAIMIKLGIELYLSEYPSK